MKITCADCRARYSVPDEKVAGKSIRVRCKKCGSAIVIRGKQLSIPNPATGCDDQVTKVVDYAAVSSRAGEGVSSLFDRDSGMFSAAGKAIEATSELWSGTEGVATNACGRKLFTTENSQDSSSEAVELVANKPASHARSENSVLFDLAALEDMAAAQASKLEIHTVPYTKKVDFQNSSDESSCLIDIRKIDHPLKTKSPDNDDDSLYENYGPEPVLVNRVQSTNQWTIVAVLSGMLLVLLAAFIALLIVMNQAHPKSETPTEKQLAELTELVNEMQRQQQQGNRK